MKIRKATQKDVNKLGDLMAEVIKNTLYYSKEARKEEVRKHNSFSLKQYLGDKKYYLCLIAEEDRKIIGFVIGRNEAGVFWLDWIGVGKSTRRKSVAESLMKKLELDLGKGGIHKIWCDTRTINKESINLLSKLKYKKLGLFKNGWYKQDFFLWEKDVVN